MNKAIRSIWPGLALASAIAGMAFVIHLLPGFALLSPLILAIVLGMVFHNTVRTPAAAKPGLSFALKRVLRGAIILLGLQLTITQVMEVGLNGFAVIAVALIATFCFTKWFGRLIGVDAKLAELIAAGTSICGASAVIAMNTVTEAADEDVAFGVACVTLFGAAAVVVYPLLAKFLPLNARDYGLWSGASIHEIAQVVAAAFQRGPEAGHIATIAKLTRVMMLAPLVFTVGLFTRMRARSGNGHPIPWFVLGFIGLVGLNSLVRIPPDILDWIAQITAFLLSVALAAMGLETDFRKLYARGLRPILLGGASWLFIATVSYFLIELVG
jgi:uncharacterized integral membrane protein (TIGR00698 family)